MSLDTYDRWACHNARFDPSHSPTNADVDGIVVAIASVVTNLCLRGILITWSPEDIDAGIQASFLQIHSVFLSTLFSVGRQQPSLFNANFALAVSTSPLTVYLSAASYCDLLGIKTGLYKRIKSHRPVTRVLGALIPLLSFVQSMIITFSDRAFVDSQACKGSTFVTWVSELSLLCLDCFTEPKSLYPLSCIFLTPFVISAGQKIAPRGIRGSVLCEWTVKAMEVVFHPMDVQSIMVVNHNGRVPGNDDALKLREHVAHLGEGRPKWDKIPDYGNNCQLNL